MTITIFIRTHFEFGAKYNELSDYFSNSLLRHIFYNHQNRDGHTSCTSIPVILNFESFIKGLYNSFAVINRQILIDPLFSYLFLPCSVFFLYAPYFICVTTNNSLSADTYEAERSRASHNLKLRTRPENVE